ncbi:MAG: tetratricopeptide repeat protein [Chloroflexota bacterium]|nr:tetratricopeptide repeat protein [Chloroflexota bacterium]
MPNHGHETAESADHIEATSLLGEPLQRPIFPDDVQKRLEAQLTEAQAAYEAAPDDVDTLLLGQRTGATGRFRQAIAVYTEGIAKHPDDARLYRYRGHRLISLRRFDEAIADLSEAARLVVGRAPEPELPAGSPLGTPYTYTLQFSIWYHLGLAQYLRGSFDQARAAYQECAAFAPTAETLVAVTHWRYMTLRRLGATEEAAAILAPITPDLPVVENRPYHRLTLLYTGILTPEQTLAPDAQDKDKGMGDNQVLMDATVGYGVGNWYRSNGDQAEAERIFRRIHDTTPPGISRFSFGYIAAEAELGRE